MHFSLRLLIATVLLVDLPASAADAPLNVILIVADDLGGADLGCYGSKYHRTPNLDRLAQSGVRFTQAYAACPVCSPTRAALMTGKWPARLHLTDWLPGRGDNPQQRLARPVIRQELPLDEVTLAELFKAKGYATGFIGKWHLGGEGFDPTRQGFDVNIAGDQTGTPLSYFAPYGRNGRVMPGLEEAPEGEYLTDRLGVEAERMIERFKDGPFFLYLPHYAVHTPMRAKQDLIATYPAAGEFQGQQNNPIYAAMLESLDEAVGRVVAKVESLGLSERTLILFTSDNGGLATIEGPNTPATSNAPFREGKGWLYEGGVRVPFIASWPGTLTAGKTVDTPVCSIDVLPTCAELCGLMVEQPVDGVSIAGLLKGSSVPERDTFFWHYPHYANQGGRPGAIVREKNYKLIEFYEDGRRELFDLAADVRESKNLAAEKPELVERLAKRLAEWRMSVDAQMPTPNANYRPNAPEKDGRIVLQARSARVQGVMLRYEPLPHKNTLGYWVNPQDWAEWDLTATEPGEYEVELLQGCGNGSGGSRIACEIAGQTLAHTVVETGGFQQFQAIGIGRIKIAEPGRLTFSVKALSKPGPAVMDLRQVVLRPVK